MEVMVCIQCRKMFQSPFGKRICPACAEKNEDDLKRVKDYLWTNKNATIPMVEEECNVKKEQIVTWLRDGRIQLSEDSGIELFCEKCGKRILSGRLCTMCQTEMTNTLNSTHKEMLQAKKSSMPQQTQIEGERAKNRMRFIGKNDVAKK